jgi:iron complex outermembrane receptor protein
VIDPVRRDQELWNLFLQDSISLVENKLTLTLGSKFEHNSFTGFEFQPGGRLLWQASKSQVLWGFRRGRC